MNTVSKTYFGLDFDDEIFNKAMKIAQGKGKDEDIDLDENGTMRHVLERFKHRVKLGFKLRVVDSIPIIGDWSKISFPDWAIEPTETYKGSLRFDGYGKREAVCVICKKVCFDYEWIFISYETLYYHPTSTVCSKTCVEDWWKKYGTDSCVRFNDLERGKVHPSELTRLATWGDIPWIHAKLKRDKEDIIVWAKVKDDKLAEQTYIRIWGPIKGQDEMKLLINKNKWEQFKNDKNILTWKQLDR